MDFMDELKNIASNVSDNFAETIDNIKDAVSDKLNSINETSNNSVEREKSFFIIPKLEMMVKKVNDNNSKDSLTIEFLMSKYIPKTLLEKFNSMSDQDKAKFYTTLGDSFTKISRKSIYPLETKELASNYYSRCFMINKNDIETAYKQFGLLNLTSPTKKGVEIAELCLKVSNYKNTENKFSQIYSYLGLYYFEKEDYKKALEQYEKVLDYSDSNSYEYQKSKLSIAKSYCSLGDYKKALETEKEIKDYEPNFPPEIEEKMAKRFTKLMLDGWHKEVEAFRRELQTNISKKQSREQKVNCDLNDVEEPEVDSIFMDNMKYNFKECLSKYPEDVLVEAYKHYLKALKLCRSKKHLKAVEEYRIVKQIIPEKTLEMDEEMCSIIHEYTVNDENREYYYNEKIKLLNERMEIILKTDHQRGLCDIFNEMAITYGYLNNTEKEIDYFKKAISIAGKASIYGTNLANCYERLGLYDDALKIYKEIAETNPSFAEQFNMNLDTEIARLNDLKLGKKWVKKEGNNEENNEENKQIALEHLKNGDEYFNKEDYENAFIEYNAAHEIDKNEIKNLIKMLMVKELYECQYLDEMKIVSNALIACEKNDEIVYLPFLFTLGGDYCLYIGYIKEARIFYELATDLLNRVPIYEKFAAPYYKLARIKEQEKKYEEALTLFQFANMVDKSYDIETDIKRIKVLYEDGEVSISKKIDNALKDMEFYLNSRSYSNVIQIGKKALEYAPDNEKIYYLICKAFEATRKNINKSQIYEFKWFAREGLRAYNDSENKYKIDYFFFYYWLGLCCKYENKLKQARECFLYPDEIDETRLKVSTKKCMNELFFMNHGKPLYKELWEGES